MKPIALAVPLLIALLAGCSSLGAPGGPDGGGGGDPLTAPGPHQGDADDVAAIASCGSDTMFGDQEGTAQDVTVVYDTAVLAVTPFCGQELVTDSGKKYWMFYYDSADDVVGRLVIAFAKNGWEGDTQEAYLTHTEDSGNVRSFRARTVLAATPATVHESFFIGLPEELSGKDVTIVELG